jgi:hypothetical protein
VEDQQQRFYLEKLDENDYRIVKAEPIPETDPPLDYGSIGYAALMLVTVSALFLARKET